MATLNHPRIPNVTIEVPDAQVRRWQASGWVAEVEVDSTPDQAVADELADDLPDFDS